MNIDELQSVRDRERQTDRPQQLRESFYADVGAFLEQLRAERERAAERHGTYADEVMQLTDEIEAARQLVEDIHERRIGKVVKAASLEAAELSPEVGGLTTEERDLFETLVADIERHRGDVLAAVDDEEPEPAESTSAESGRAAKSDDTAGATGRDDTGVSAADVMSDGASGEPATTAGRDGGREGRDGGDRDTRSEHPDPEELRSDASGNPERSRDVDSPTVEASDSSGPGPGSDRPDGPAHSDDGDDAPDGPTRGNGRDGGAGSNGRGDNGASSGRDDTRSERASRRGDTAENESAPTLGESIERERVLVTEDVSTFVGSDDRDYDLAADDVVTLPATNADILVERDAARRL